VKRSETPAKTAHKHISAEGTTDFLSPTSGFIFALFNLQGFRFASPPACVLYAPSGLMFYKLYASGAFCDIISKNSLIFVAILFAISIFILNFAT
jgi:hypothetical protein